jgi:hypothetical protein
MIYKKIDSKCRKSVVENSKYLDEKLKNSKNALLLHNVNIEYQGESVTIDHVLISRMGIEILKSKNFNNEEISIGGDSALIIDSRHYSNPLEKLLREKTILEQFLEEKLTLTTNKYWFVESKIRIEATVLFGVNSNIINEKLPTGFDRIEEYLAHREEKISKVSSINAFKLLVNMLNAEVIQEIASLLSVKKTISVYDNERLKNENLELIAS